MSLQITNLKKNFQQGDTQIQVLRALNLNLNDGEIIAILGESGSGKSTFLSLVSGLEMPDEGEIKINGVNICALTETEQTKYRAENISIVFQQYHLLSHLTALENVMLPAEILKRKESESSAREILGELGLGHRLNHFPSQLSGGECQRVAIARALLTRPKLLLADEPSGNLDPKTGESVLNSFFDVIQKYKITTLFVTHSEVLAARCQRVFRLEAGKLLEVLK